MAERWTGDRNERNQDRRNRQSRSSDFGRDYGRDDDQGLSGFWDDSEQRRARSSRDDEGRYGDRTSGANEQRQFGGDVDRDGGRSYERRSWGDDDNRGYGRSYYGDRNDDQRFDASLGNSSRSVTSDWGRSGRERDRERDRPSMQASRDWDGFDQAQDYGEAQGAGRFSGSQRSFDNDWGGGGDYRQGYRRERNRRDALNDRSFGGDRDDRSNIATRYGRESGYGGRRGMGAGMSGGVGSSRPMGIGGYGASGSGYGGYAYDDEQQRGFGSTASPMQNYRGRGPKAYKKSDERLKEQVCEMLSESPEVDATEIDIQVSSGHVTLSGFVDSRYAKRRAEDLIEELAGVDDVTNNIRVRSQADQRIPSSYQGATERSGSEYAGHYQSGADQSGPAPDSAVSSQPHGTMASGASTSGGNGAANKSTMSEQTADADKRRGSGSTSTRT